MEQDKGCYASGNGDIIKKYMKKVVCKNCGGVFSDELEKCPYCSTMHKKGSYRSFRKKVAGFIDKLLDLKDDAYESLSKMVPLSILKGLLIALICIGIGYVWSVFTNVNYYSDEEYDAETYEDIIWEDENLDALENAYAQGDFDTIKKLFAENRNVVYNWEHYSSYALKSEHDKILNEKYFSEYNFDEILYYLYNPTYFANMNRMSEQEYQEYEESKKDIIAYMNKLGYKEEELRQIYETNHDEYGYVRSADLKQYIKEQNNG